ncbi:MAG: UPF0182 family protein, partial [Balneolaceae bacterium]
ALWDQRGSRVIRGNLMVIPIENSFLYVEPVFLLAEGVDIPQLQRVIVAIGDNIAMQPTIEAAMFELFGEDAGFLAPGIMPAITGADEIRPVEISLDEVQSEEYNAIRNLWRDLRSALENGEWERYGELMRQIDDLIGS